MGLLKALRQDNERVRLHATRALWQRWYAEAGPEAERQLLAGTASMEQQRFAEAEQEFSQLIQQHPDFAEAYNKRATLHYICHRYDRSLRDCHRVVELNPHHFGAWHGMGLCYFALDRYPEALPAFRRALEIQPFAQINQAMSLECLVRMS
ncbi:tetratricopeptide repeat protein [Leptolyngbya sp. FACHB-261]|nr:tetratricopeptide repeat protein [Leptolyngbya sp. FACHB-261]